MSECEGQIGGVCGGVFVEPLFKLIDDDEQSFVVWEPFAVLDAAEDFRERKICGDFWEQFAEAIEELGFGVAGGGFEVDAFEEVAGEEREESGFDEGRFPAAAGAVNQSDGEGIGSVAGIGD